MSMIHRPFRRALIAAGVKHIDKALLYQDYLYELSTSGHNNVPITESQWDIMCSIMGATDRPWFASSVKPMLEQCEIKKGVDK